MTTTVNSMKETIDALRENEIDAKSAVEIAKMNFL